MSTMDRYYKPGTLLETLNFYFHLCLDVKKSGGYWLSVDHLKLCLWNVVSVVFLKVLWRRGVIL